MCCEPRRLQMCAALLRFASTAYLFEECQTLSVLRSLLDERAGLDQMRRCCNPNTGLGEPRYKVGQPAACVGTAARRTLWLFARLLVSCWLQSGASLSVIRSAPSKCRILWYIVQGQRQRRLPKGLGLCLVRIAIDRRSLAEAGLCATYEAGCETSASLASLDSTTVAATESRPRFGSSRCSSGVSALRLRFPVAAVSSSQSPAPVFSPQTKMCRATASAAATPLATRGLARLASS